MNKKIMKIITQITSALIITGTTNASEYIIKDYHKDNKEKIYEIVSKYRFPSILNPSIQQEFATKYPKLDLIQTFETKDTEYKFIQNEIKNINKQAQVYAIPKSLYQLIVYDYFATIEFDDDIHTLTTIKLLSDAQAKIGNIREKFDLKKYANENAEYGITKACKSFMKGKDIQEFFWYVNDYTLLLDNFGSCNFEKITLELLDNYKNDRLLDETTITQQQGLKASYKLDTARIEILKGKNNIARKELRAFITNCILSEHKNPNYIVYRGGFEQPNSEIALRKLICFSDGLFSGYVFDAGASAFVLSANPNKLWKLELNRRKLLNGELPIFIPPAQHLLSAAGNGELFHVRTKVVQGVISKDYKDRVDPYELSITAPIKPLTYGYKLTETPELFTTQDPQMLQRIGDKYQTTLAGKFDQNGAAQLKTMIQSTEEVAKDGVF